MKELNRTDRLNIAVIIILVVITVGLISLSPPDFEYDISAEDMLAELALYEDEIFPDEVAGILEYGDSGYFFVDVRNPHEYHKSHLDAAVNIPVHDILEEESQELFEQLSRDSLTVIMYGEDQLQANGAWMVLKQIGFNNIMVMLGGYEYYTTGPLDLYDMPEIPEYLVEEPAYDFQAVVDEMGGEAIINESTEAPEIILPERKQKKRAAEGGC